MNRTCERTATASRPPAQPANDRPTEPDQLLRRGGPVLDPKRTSTRIRWCILDGDGIIFRAPCFIERGSHIEPGGSIEWQGAEARCVNASGLLETQK